MTFVYFRFNHSTPTYCFLFAFHMLVIKLLLCCFRLNECERTRNLSEKEKAGHLEELEGVATRVPAD